MLNKTLLKRNFNKHIGSIFLDIMTVNAHRIPKQYIHSNGK